MKTLILNLGPSGDVLRTTVLLRVLPGEIYWLTKSKCKDVLQSKRIDKLFFSDNPLDLDNLRRESLDNIISLNEEEEAISILDGLKTKRVIGLYKAGDKISYTPESAYRFDTSLVSKFGKAEADKRKIINRKSYPQILIEMAGFKWVGQEYDLGIEKKDSRGRIGIVNIENGKWPNKLWYGFDELKKVLQNKNYKVVELGMRPTIADHIEDINKCELVVSGDTLGMHIALALKKKVVTLFTCTSPHEIYDYGRLTKIVSPLYEKYFYDKTFYKEAVEAIKVGDVVSSVEKCLKMQVSL